MQKEHADPVTGERNPAADRFEEIDQPESDRPVAESDVPDGVGAAVAAADQNSTAESEEAGTAGASLDTEVEQLRAKLDAAQAKADANWDMLLRSRAEVENLQRRHERDLHAAHKFAIDNFVRELLQVWDSLELGHSAAQDDKVDVAKLKEGTELTLKLLGDVMRRFGVEQIDPQGQPFNPDQQQAISMQPRDDMPPGTVVTVVQKGYSLNGRLVRPAMVVVSQSGN